MSEHRRERQRPSNGPQPRVEVRRSKKRTRTVAVFREGDTVVVLMPARIPKADEPRWVDEMLGVLERKEARQRARDSDSALMARCAQLAKRYLDPALQPDEVRWVPQMRTRWASCTPVERSIRVSERLRKVPPWVLDYVLVHELAHLKFANHSREFWEMVHNYPRTDRAYGYLEGLAAGEGWPISEDTESGDDAADLC